MSEVDNNTEYCKNCGDRLYKVFIADTEFAGHWEWRHDYNGSVYCKLSRTAEPMGRPR